MTYTERLRTAQSRAMECALALENRLNTLDVYCRVDVRTIHKYTGARGLWQCKFTFLVLKENSPIIVEYKTTDDKWLMNEDFVTNVGQFMESEILEALGHTKQLKPIVTLDDLLGFVKGEA